MKQNAASNQKNLKESLLKEKREILIKLKKLEEDELFLDEEMYNVLSQIQEIIFQNPPNDSLFLQEGESYDGD